MIKDISVLPCLTILINAHSQWHLNILDILYIFRGSVVIQGVCSLCQTILNLPFRQDVAEV